MIRMGMLTVVVVVVVMIIMTMNTKKMYIHENAFIRITLTDEIIVTI